MSKYTITPWRTHTDLLSVRTQLYSTDVTAQRKAVDRVLAWKLRGNLPHAVESTALLIEAQLHHSLQAQTPVISSFSIRAVYTAAFTRFVTGFCDIGRAKERTLEPSSMLDIAKQIGMPTEFVALRHEATHEEMPGLRRLVEATEKALEWLWQVYWSKLEEPESEEAAEASLAAFKAEMMDFLKEFRRIRRDALKSRTKSRDRETGIDETVVAECVMLCKGARPRVEALARILVEERLILPSTRELGSSLDGAYLIWDALLISLCQDMISFLSALVTSLLKSLTASSATNSATDANKEALAMWVLHVVESDEYTSARAEDHDALLSMVMKWCCLHPGHWTQRVGSELLENCADSFREAWEDLLEASLISTEGEASEEAQLGAVADNTDAADGAMEDDEDAVQAIGGWSRAVAPPKVSIGIVAQ